MASSDRGWILCIMDGTGKIISISEELKKNVRDYTVSAPGG